MKSLHLNLLLCGVMLVFAVCAISIPDNNEAVALACLALGGQVVNTLHINYNETAIREVKHK